MAAVRALGLEHVALVVTKADRADPGPVRADALERLARHGIRPVATATVSARTGAGVEDARAALATLAAAAPEGDPAAPVRLWVDRSFTVTGAGTIVTGTLPTGSLRRDDVLRAGTGEVRVRGLEVHGSPVDVATGPTRLAVNLRGVAPAAVPRGTALVLPRRVPPGDRPRRRAPPARRAAARPRHAPRRDDDHAGPRPPAGLAPRSADPRPAPASRRRRPRRPARPGAHEVLAGVSVVEADPPAFTRRGDAARRAARAAPAGPAHLPRSRR